MNQCPIDYFETNLIFDNTRNCWGAFRLEGFNYDFLGDEKKKEILRRLARLIASIVDEAKILMIPVVQDIGSHSKKQMERLDEGDILYPYAASHIEQTAGYLKSLAEHTGSANDYDFYIVTKLVSEAEKDLVAKALEALKVLGSNPIQSTTALFDSIFGIGGRDIPEAKVQNFVTLSNHFLQEQNKRLKMRTTTSAETQWLLKRVMYRGCESGIRLNQTRKLFRHQDGTKIEVLSDWSPFRQELSPQNGAKALRPYLKDTVNLFKGVLNPDTPRRITVTHDDGTVSYQTFLTIPHIPFEQEFPGCEWLNTLQYLGCQCEVCIHIKNVEHREAMRKVDHKKREITSQYENVAKAGGDIPDDLQDGFDESAYLEKELKAAKDPICRVCVSVAVSSPDPEDMEQKAAHVRQVYEDQHFQVERPAADQEKLFLQHIPGTGLYTSDYVMNLTPTTLAGGIIGAVSNLGDNEGGFIGTTGRTDKQVFLRLALACMNNKSGSAAFMGNLGYGKSFNANLVAYLLVLLDGGYALIIDPKGERGHWKGALPIPEELVTVVTLSADDADAGKLDPFLMYRDSFDEASSLALNALSDLFDLKPKDNQYTVLSECIEALRQVEQPSMAGLVDIIASVGEDDTFYREADQLARSIKSMRNVGLSKLMFGNGDEEAISLDNRINIIQAQNLQLPGPDTPKEDYTLEESISSVLMVIMGHFAKRFAQVKWKNSQGFAVPKVCLFDESWAFARTAAGRSLFNYMARMGRSLYTCSLFNGHSLLDLADEGVRNAITYAFFFHSDNRDECVRMLEFLHMDITDENIELIQKLENRECLFRDAEGRVGKLTFDCVFDDLMEVFSTTPEGAA